MLKLKVRKGEPIFIGNDITVVFLNDYNQNCQTKEQHKNESYFEQTGVIGIAAPDNVKILRMDQLIKYYGKEKAIEIMTRAAQ